MRVKSQTVTTRHEQGHHDRRAAEAQDPGQGALVEMQHAVEEALHDVVQPAVPAPRPAA